MDANSIGRSKTVSSGSLPVGAEEKQALKMVFNGALLVFFLSGLAILAINFLAKQRNRQSSTALTKALWKFVPEVNMRERRRELGWNCAKLLLLGLVVASLSVAVFAKRLGVTVALQCGAGLLGSSVFGILFFWFWYIEPTLAKNREGVDKKNNLVESDELKKKIDEATAAAWKAKFRRRAGEDTDAAAATDAATAKGAARQGQGEGDSDVNEQDSMDTRLPMTIVTGFLGAGKTTLIKNILNNTRGLRVLVIENEVGNESIDHELLMQHTTEEIVKMDNGCVCCTVRKDVLVAFHRMFENEAFAKLDWVVIETTGLADPAPLMQSLYMDALCASKMRLDGVLAVVDAKHLPLHLAREEKLNKDPKTPDGAKTAGAHGGASEARLQIVFADRILINKVDLVTPQELSDVQDAVQKMNPVAEILQCTNSDVALDSVLNIHAFDVNRNEGLLMQVDPNKYLNITRARTSDPLKPQKPLSLSFLQQDADGNIIFPSNSKKSKSNAGTGTGKKDGAASSSSVGGGSRRHQGMLNSDSIHVKKAVEALNSVHERRSRVVAGVSTISLTSEDAINLDAFNTWVANILRNHGEKLYRIKGILWMHGYAERFVAHGIHMVFDGERGTNWEQPVEERRRLSRLVFIGLDLNHEELTAGFYACMEKEQGEDGAVARKGKGDKASGKDD